VGFIKKVICKSAKTFRALPGILRKGGWNGTKVYVHGSGEGNISFSKRTDGLLSGAMISVFCARLCGCKLRNFPSALFPLDSPYRGSSEIFLPIWK